MFKLSEEIPLHGTSIATHLRSSRALLSSVPDQLELFSSSERAPEPSEPALPARTTAVYNTYWRFAAERQRVFFRKLEGELPPWSDDPIIAHHKFTNAYRASDRVSQYLIRAIIYDGDQSVNEVFFRILLFKLFNKIDTWELLQSNLGPITYRDFSFRRYDDALTAAISSNTRIYSPAYMMPSGVTAFGHKVKHRNHLALLQKMMRDGVPCQISEAPNMREAFDILHSYPMIGPFLGYQFVTDLNYSEICDFSEMEFVVPGPGALDGLHKCFSDFGGLNEKQLIALVADIQQQEFNRLGLEFKSLWGRPLQLIDCQNLFCEVSKYARVAHPEIRGVNSRYRIKQIYRPSHNALQYWFPPKWDINHLLPRSLPSKGQLAFPQQER